MRKKNKEITDQEVIEGLLQRVAVGYLATVGSDGWPVVKPLNFCYNSGRIYFHSAQQGEKLDHIRANNRVSLAVALPIAYVRGSQENPCAAEFLYQ
ncbi:MAG TPA: pyridoxamine 5'-phosphate oxidase family protein, partial [Geobacterales bacterium]|nr:pyridoxamine 5'-phosphate oxidase family protein [Geobacterales bacterium]